MIIRYAKFLYDNYRDGQEGRFPKNKEFLLNLQEKHGLVIDDISDYDFQAEKDRYNGIGLPEDDENAENSDGNMDFLGIDLFDEFNT